MFDDFVSKDTTPLYQNASGTKSVCHLLWGDGVRFVGAAGSGDRRKVTARGGRSGFVNKSALGGASLLEFYFIDVGQGDGVLIKTPGFRHIMIDGGFPRSVQDTGKNAADFVDWKFFKDYGMSTIELDAMIASHCDADHYGGLKDLLDIQQKHELDATDAKVEAFYHAGLSWWKNGTGKSLGTHEKVGSDSFWTRLLDNRTHATAVTSPGAPEILHGWWGDFITTMLASKRKSGQPTGIQRLSNKDSFLPKFNSSAGGEPQIHVLGPVEFSVNNKPALRRFSGGTSINTNGVSLLLRVDFGRTRTLLTGDLNKASQATLLEDYTGQRSEFECDVAKACHHGSEDVSYRFLQAMRPAATIISSGDNEGHDHPRPSIIAASATTGYMQLSSDDDELLTPLVYSTELSRSIDLGFPQKLEEIDSAGAVTKTIEDSALDRAILHLSGSKKSKVNLGKSMVVGGLIYGLINVRTDGDRILCATLDESSNEWRIKSFTSRF
jgi:beta-lactamase superfamily II metal-dependent hydrolase